MMNERTNTSAGWETHLDETKRGLAKLLARENITVRHETGVKTASFDLASRTLILPKWSTITVDQYDLLIGHEVAHAKWSDDLSALNAPDMTPGLHSFINVLEDTRIERKIKEEFPGLRGSFRRGYADFYANGPIFQDVTVAAAAKMSFIDRVNVHYKIGDHVTVPFSAAERAILSRIDNLRTMSDAVSLARELYTAAKEQHQQDQQNQQDQLAADTPEEQKSATEGQSVNADEPKEQNALKGASGQTSDDSEGESEESKKPTDQQPTSDQSESEKQSSEKQVQTGAGQTGGDPMSLTDAQNQEAMRTLETSTEDGVTQVTVGEYPDAFVKAFTISIADYMRECNTHVSTKTRHVAQTYLTHFRKEQGRVIRNLAAEFERKKTAKLYEHAKTARTGKLDVNKLHAYKFREDLFKSVTILPNGKNHGIIVLIDMSGSMGNLMKDTLIQLMLFAEFARRVNIPIQAYAFGLNLRRDVSHAYWFVSDHTIVPTSDATVLTLLDSTAGRWTEQMLMLAARTAIYDSEWQLLNRVSSYQSNLHTVPYIQLGGTPLSSALLIIERHLARLKATHKLDKVSLIVLTDGEDGGHICEKAATGNALPIKLPMLRDTVTRSTHAYFYTSKYDYRTVDRYTWSMQMACELIRRRHDARIIGLRLAENARGRRGDVKHVGRGFIPEYISCDAKLVKEIEMSQRDWRADNIAILPSALTPFADRVIAIAGNQITLDTDEQEHFDKLTTDASDKQILTAFKKASLAGVKSRIFINAVMPFLA